LEHERRVYIRPFEASLERVIDAFAAKS